MIYVDSSVALAELLAEDRMPPDDFWQRDLLVASRLLEYEVWNGINGRGLQATHGDNTQTLLDWIVFVELAPPVLQRALEPFPARVRTLDSLHLASIEFLQRLGEEPQLATYDVRLAAAASSMGIPIVAL